MRVIKTQDFIMIPVDPDYELYNIGNNQAIHRLKIYMDLNAFP